MGKLDEIAALKDEFDFRMLVDDAHGFGTMGETGAGAGEHFGVQDKIDLYFSTLLNLWQVLVHLSLQKKKSLIS